MTPEDIELQTKSWLADYLRTYHRKNVTPYIHVFQAHLYEFVELYGDINSFNQQGHEKFNDLTTIQYFKSTNKKLTANSGFLLQLLQKRNRIELINMQKYN